MNEPSWNSLDERSRSRTWTGKFSDALRGMKLGVRGESSFFVHFFCTVAVVMAGWAVKLTRQEWAILAACIGAVYVAELFNSALERLARAITRDEDPNVRDALDVSSGAVLAAALSAVVVGYIVLWQKLMTYFGF